MAYMLDMVIILFAYFLILKENGNFNISHAGNLIEDKELFTISIVVSLMISKAMKLIF